MSLYIAWSAVVIAENRGGRAGADARLLQPDTPGGFAERVKLGVPASGTWRRSPEPACDDLVDDRREQQREDGEEHPRERVVDEVVDTP